MFNKRLKELRQKNNLTQLQLAEILNLSASSITMYENSKRLPDIHTILNIAKHFNVSVDYLIGNSDITNANIIFESDILNSINELSQEKISVLKQLIDILAKDDF